MRAAANNGTRNRALVICGILVLLAIVYITGSGNLLQGENDPTRKHNTVGEDAAATRRKRKLSSSDLLTHLSKIHHGPLASENSKSSQRALDEASVNKIISAKKKGGEKTATKVTESSSSNSLIIAAANNNKVKQQQPDSFARQHIRISLVNAHKDLSNFNQGITIADLKRFQQYRNQLEEGGESPKLSLNEDNNLMKKKDPISILKQKRKGSSLLSLSGRQSQFSLVSSARGTHQEQQVLRQLPWQEAYMFARASARANITLPPHPVNVLQRALDLDNALAKREKANKPLIHQAIEDSDKTRFGDAPGMTPKSIDGIISLGGDAISGSGEVVIPGGILRDDTIFVTIASYRDSECAPTILDLFSKARYPRAITVGIAVQHDKEQDPSCIPKEFLTSNEHCQNTYGFCPTDNIRTRVVSHRDAKGPTFGRYLGMLLYRGERYIFMMDSHNRFVTHWDFIIVNMYKRLEAGDFGSYEDDQHDAEARKIFSYPETGSVYRYAGNNNNDGGGGDLTKKVVLRPGGIHNNNENAAGGGGGSSSGASPSSRSSSFKRRAAGKFGITKPVLSHYPEAWFHPGEAETGSNRPLDRRGTTTYMCRGKYLEWGVFRLDGNVISKPARPLPQGWAAAGFLFARGEILAEVPFDPYLDYVFDGEEISYSIRMWTHGWDIFSPNENILYHYYGRKKAKRFWEVVPANWTARKLLGEKRIQHLLQAVPKGSSQPPLRHIPIPAPPLLLDHHHAAAADAAVAEAIVTKTRNSNTTTNNIDDEPTSTISLDDFTKAAASVPWAREIEKYGLGAERPLAAYYSYAGLNPTTREFKEGWFCSRKH